MLTKNIITDVFFLNRMIHQPAVLLNSVIAAYEFRKEHTFFVLNKRGKTKNVGKHTYSTVDIAPKLFTLDELKEVNIPADVENIWIIDRSSPAFDWLTLGRGVGLEVPASTRISVGAC